MATHCRCVLCRYVFCRGIFVGVFYVGAFLNVCFCTDALKQPPHLKLDYYLSRRSSSNSESVDLLSLVGAGGSWLRKNLLFFFISFIGWPARFSMSFDLSLMVSKSMALGRPLKWLMIGFWLYLENPKYNRGFWSWIFCSRTKKYLFFFFRQC